MDKIFRAEKMLNRIKEEGREDLLDEKTIAFIKSMDGHTGTDYNWESYVHGRPLVYMPEFSTYVAEVDCD